MINLQIDKVFSTSRDFFAQPLAVKEKYGFCVQGENCGYVAFEQER
jgi:isopenicillin N synthase-like dioxygenase